MHRTSRRGWLLRLAARRQKVGFGTPSSKRRTGNQTEARRLRAANAGPSTGRDITSTGPHAAELAFDFRGCRTVVAEPKKPLAPSAHQHPETNFPFGTAHPRSRSIFFPILEDSTPLLFLSRCFV